MYKSLLQLRSFIHLIHGSFDSNANKLIKNQLKALPLLSIMHRDQLTIRLDMIEYKNNVNEMRSVFGFEPIYRLF